jgi:large subunit ribosomal protein L30
MPRTFVWHPGKGPAKTRKLDLPETGTVRIKQVRSGIGHSWRMNRTLEAIGLKHHQDVVVKEITPGLVGQLKQVRHLIEVTVEEGK